MHHSSNDDEIPKYRININSLDSTQSDRYKEVFSKIMQIRDNRGYSYIAGFHGVPGFYCWHHQRDLGNRSILRTRLFLPWHRAYLKVLEDLLQDHSPEVTLCWWRWPRQEETDKSLPTHFTLPAWNERDNPLFKFHIDMPQVRLPDGPDISLDEDTFREPGSNPFARLPAEESLKNLLEIDDYGAFSDALEDIHDNIHGWVGGSMSDVYRAAFDPIFFHHHANVDRWWRMWQLKHGDLNIPQELLDVPLEPFPYTVKDVLDVFDLGYDYADSSSEVVIQ